MVDENNNGKEPENTVQLPKPDLTRRRDGRNEGGVVRIV